MSGDRKWDVIDNLDQQLARYCQMIDAQRQTIEEQRALIEKLERRVQLLEGYSVPWVFTRQVI